MIDRKYVRRMVSIARKAVKNEEITETMYSACNKDSFWIDQIFRNSGIGISYVSKITLEGCFDYEITISHFDDEVFFYDFSKKDPKISDDRNWERDLFSLEKRLS